MRILVLLLFALLSVQRAYAGDVTVSPGNGMFKAGAHELELKAGDTAGVYLAKIQADQFTRVGIGGVPLQESTLIVDSSDLRAPDIARTMQVRRFINANATATNPQALRVWTRIGDGVTYAGLPWSFSGEIENHANDNTSPEGGVGTSGAAHMYGLKTGIMFGGHFQGLDKTGGQHKSALLGAEINIAGDGNAPGLRVGADVVAKGVSLPGAVHDYGLRVRNGGGPVGARWDVAIKIEDGTQPLQTGLLIDTSWGTGGVGVLDKGEKDYGIRLMGSYAGAAVAVETGQNIQWGLVGGLPIRVRLEDGIVRFHRSTVNQLGLGVSPGKEGYYVYGTRVVGPQETGWTAATGIAERGAFDTETATVIEVARRLKAVGDLLRKHGLSN